MGNWECIGNADNKPRRKCSSIAKYYAPENAVHGRGAVELTIRIKEGDSSGLSEIVFPLRVAVIHDFSLSGQGDWVVSRDGGYPLAFIENQGNTPKYHFNSDTQPATWLGDLEGTTCDIGVGEVSGVPIELLPDESWEGDVKTIRILAEDSEGSKREISMDTRKESHSWSS